MMGNDEGDGLLAQTIANGSSSPKHIFHSLDSKKNMLQKALAYDAPERVYVNQKDIGL